jgi:hypothetical protein
MRSHNETVKQIATKGINPKKRAPSEGGFIRIAGPGLSFWGLKAGEIVALRKIG